MISGIRAFFLSGADMDHLEDLPTVAKGVWVCVAVSKDIPKTSEKHETPPNNGVFV